MIEDMQDKSFTHYLLCFFPTFQLYYSVQQYIFQHPHGNVLYPFSLKQESNVDKKAEI